MYSHFTQLVSGIQEGISMRHTLAMIAVLALSACGPAQQPVQYQQQPQPVIVQQPIQYQQQPQPVIVQQQSNDHMLGGMVAGGALGYLLGRSSQQVAPSTTVIERHTTIIDRSAPAPAAAPARPSFAAPNPTQPAAPARPSFVQAQPYRAPAAPPRVSYGSGFSRPSSSFSRPSGGRR